MQDDCLSVDLRPMLKDLGVDSEQIERMMAIGPPSLRIERPITMDEFLTMLLGQGWRVDEHGNLQKAAENEG